MKTAEQYFKTHYGNCHIRDVVALKDLKSLFALMEEYAYSYANTKLDEAAELVSEHKLEYIDFYDFSKGVESSVNQDRIDVLKLKDEIQ